MKPYELTVLVHPDLEMSLDKTLTKVTKLIKDNNGVIKNQDVWGKKKLAYPIDKQEFAVYVAFELDLPGAAVAKISNGLNINKEILRYLLVKEDERIKAARAEAGSETKEEVSETDEQ